MCFTVVGYDDIAQRKQNELSVSSVFSVAQCYPMIYLVCVVVRQK